MVRFSPTAKLISSPSSRASPLSLRCASAGGTAAKAETPTKRATIKRRNIHSPVRVVGRAWGRHRQTRGRRLGSRAPRGNVGPENALEQRVRSHVGNQVARSRVVRVAKSHRQDAPLD